MKQIIFLIIAVYIVGHNSEQLLGGISTTNKDDSHVQQLMIDHLKRLNTGDAGELHLLEVSKLSSQIVQGKLYKVEGKFQQGDATIKCKLEIWEQSWLKGNDAVSIEADCGEKETRKKFKSA